jgi:hypothetical protein
MRAASQTALRPVHRRPHNSWEIPEHGSRPPPAPVPLEIGLTPFEDRLDVIERVTAHARPRDLAVVSLAEAMSLAVPVALARLSPLAVK